MVVMVHGVQVVKLTGLNEEHGNKEARSKRPGEHGGNKARREPKRTLDKKAKSKSLRQGYRPPSTATYLYTARGLHAASRLRRKGTVILRLFRQE